MYASKTTRGFYDTAIHGDNMPEDMVEITAEEHAALLEGQSNGQVIDWGEDGYPFLTDPPAPTDEQVVTVERQWRNNELARADIELNKVQDGMGTGTVTQWREYRCALRNWPESTDFPDVAKRPIAPDTV